jgi:hypothetical protein
VLAFYLLTLPVDLLLSADFDEAVFASAFSEAMGHPTEPLIGGDEALNSSSENYKLKLIMVYWNLVDGRSPNAVKLRQRILQVISF